MKGKRDDLESQSIRKREGEEGERGEEGEAREEGSKTNPQPNSPHIRP